MWSCLRNVLKDQRAWIRGLQIASWQMFSPLLWISEVLVYYETV